MLDGGFEGYTNWLRRLFDLANQSLDK